MRSTPVHDLNELIVNEITSAKTFSFLVGNVTRSNSRGFESRRGNFFSDENNQLMTIFNFFGKTNVILIFFEKVLRKKCVAIFPKVLLHQKRGISSINLLKKLWPRAIIGDSAFQKSQGSSK
jgi:hypothetical protein